MDITAFFDNGTYTASYVVADPATSFCAVIDPVLDFDPDSGRISHQSADRIIAHIRADKLKLSLILETHAHADHLSAAHYIKSMCGGAIIIGANIVQVQKTFAKLFNLGSEFEPTGQQFDQLLGDNESFAVGRLVGRALATPGHTPACMTYVIEDAAFVGDTLFMPDYGTARADFPGGDARTLYRSIRRILTLPNSTRIYLCHDYKAPGRDQFVWETTVAEQRRHNIHVHDGITEEAFVAMREARDKTLAMPHLILPSLQVNIRAGQLPPAEDNDVVYLKLPINAL
ncbi:MAG: MBL fold metallo-hydrolase [Rhodospirillaceae bacterium]|nr:MAG: MBL fold metallo-hydrolase [Rhodospirillaceae bacterium]